MTATWRAGCHPSRRALHAGDVAPLRRRRARRDRRLARAGHAARRGSSSRTRSAPGHGTSLKAPFCARRQAAPSRRWQCDGPPAPGRT